MKIISLIIGYHLLVGLKNTGHIRILNNLEDDEIFAYRLLQRLEMKNGTRDEDNKYSVREGENEN